MVEYEPDRSKIITDIPEHVLDELLEIIKQEFKICRLDESVSINNPKRESEIMDIEMFQIFIVGSWARGTSKGKLSDIDIMIIFTSPQSDFLTRRQEIASKHIAWCIEENLEGTYTDKFSDWFNGFDVLDSKLANKYNSLERYTRESRDDRPLGTQQVFSLEERVFISRRTIVNEMDFDAVDF